MTNNGEPLSSEELMLRLLHPFVKIRKVHDAGHVGFTKLDTPRHLKRRSHIETCSRVNLSAWFLEPEVRSRNEKWGTVGCLTIQRNVIS
jgi:hypothetical protein